MAKEPAQSNQITVRLLSTKMGDTYCGAGGGKDWSEWRGEFSVTQDGRRRVNVPVVPSLSVVTVVQLEAALPMLLKQAALSW